jgi:hypothetical protein
MLLQERKRREHFVFENNINRIVKDEVEKSSELLLNK